MIIGVTQDQEKIILNILQPFLSNFDFFYYGSRVKGNFEKSSDLDILIRKREKNNNILNVIEIISKKFDQSDLPFIVNLTNYHNIKKIFTK